MKKKLGMVLLTVVLGVSTVACGKEEEAANGVAQEIITEEVSVEAKEETAEVKEEVSKEDDLPNWRGIGDHFGYYVTNIDGSLDMVDINICYPSLKPASTGWAYQMDPALVLVGEPGYTADLQNIMVDSIEQTLEASEDLIFMLLDNYRDYHYKNFDFVVESEEAVTINGLSTYKYVGKHTYTYDDVAQEIPFVAYSIDTQQVANTYPTVIVMDDSINNTSMEPLAEGTIEAYAKKMVESITINE